MSELYLRKVILDIVPERGEGKKIEDLRIRFRCEKTNESTPNDGKIEIFNLADNTRSMLEGKNTRVKLQIGYLGVPQRSSAGLNVTGTTGNVELVFIGNVTKAVHKIEGGEKPDIITTLEVADGGNKFRNARLDKGYPPNTTLQRVYDDLITELGLGKGSVKGIPDKTYANGLALSGLVRDHLNTLSRANKLEWSIQDETLQIIPQQEGATSTTIELDPDSGLIGSPSKTAKGVEFNSLIQPKIRPGTMIKLTSKLVSGIFKVRKVVHEGDSHQGEFLSKCEATK